MSGHHWSLLMLLYIVTNCLHTSSGFPHPDYLPTLPEDPLQPVWNNLDTLPVEILKGFKDQIDSHTHQMQVSLAEILSRLSSLEGKVQTQVTSLRDDIGDLVTDRLVNAETMILEGISKLSNAMTSSVGENCNVQKHMTSLTEKLAVISNATMITEMSNCFARAEEETVKIEEAAAKVEAAATRMEEVVMKVEEAAGVTDALDRVERVATTVKNGSKTHQTRSTTQSFRTVNSVFLPRDCSDIHWQQPEAVSGVYQTYPTLDPKSPVQAYCDMKGLGAKETGGWTVVLRRQNSSWGFENFNRSWMEYREGFGHPGAGEWWYGLAPLHALTYRQPYEVEFILHDLELGTFQASYSTFRVDSEGSDFRLLISGFSGNVTYDAMASVHHGEPFSTYDRDQDSFGEGNCASNNGGGWWYNRCHRAALTATFPAILDRDSRTIRWYTPDAWLVLNDVVMKMRPTNYGQRFHTYMDGE